MAYTDINSEDRLVQQTFAEHLEDVMVQQGKSVSLATCCCRA